MYFTKSSNKLFLGLTFAVSVTQLLRLCEGLTNVYADLLEKPQYEVVMGSPLIPESSFDPIPSKEESKSLDKPREPTDSNSVKILMRNYLGKKFLCTVPTPPPPVTLNTPEQDMPKQDLDKMVKRGLELLKPLQDNCIKALEGWWTYEYCHQKHVKQYHLGYDGELPEVSIEFFLGRYKSVNNEEALVSVQSMAGRKYLVQHWADGTRCDLNGKPRTIEIQYHCNTYPESRIVAVKEVSTCNYSIIIYTPYLCNDPFFVDEEESQHYTIQCEPVVSEESTRQENKSNNLRLEQLKNQGARADDRVFLRHAQDPKDKRKDMNMENDQQSNQEASTRNPTHARLRIINEKNGRKLPSDQLIIEIIRSEKDKQEPAQSQLLHSQKASQLEKMYQKVHNDDQEKETYKSEL